MKVEKRYRYDHLPYKLYKFYGFNSHETVDRFGNIIYMKDIDYIDDDMSDFTYCNKSGIAILRTNRFRKSIKEMCLKGFTWTHYEQVTKLISIEESCKTNVGRTEWLFFTEIYKYLLPEDVNRILDSCYKYRLRFYRHKLKYFIYDNQKEYVKICSDGVIRKIEDYF